MGPYCATVLTVSFITNKSKLKKSVNIMYHTLRSFNVVIPTVYVVRVAGNDRNSLGASKLAPEMQVQCDMGQAST